jgi:transaldolase
LFKSTLDFIEAWQHSKVSGEALITFGPRFEGARTCVQRNVGACLAYQIYKEIFGSDRFRKLAAQGARVQRLLWASTSVKNPDYSDVKYVEALIGPDTVDTAPLETLDAYRDHGKPKARLEQDVKEARWVLERLPELGVSIDKVTRQLEDEGVEKFNKPFDKLMEVLAQRSPQYLTRES